MSVNVCMCVFLQCHLMYSKSPVYTLGVFVFSLCGFMPNPDLSVQKCAKNMTNACVIVPILGTEYAGCKQSQRWFLLPLAALFCKTRLLGWQISECGDQLTTLPHPECHTSEIKASPMTC